MTSNRDLFLQMQQEAAAQERSRIVREKCQQLQYLEIDSKSKTNASNNHRDGNEHTPERNEEQLHQPKDVD